MKAKAILFNFGAYISTRFSQHECFTIVTSPFCFFGRKKKAKGAPFNLQYDETVQFNSKPQADQYIRLFFCFLVACGSFKSAPGKVQIVIYSACDAGCHIRPCYSEKNDFPLMPLIRLTSIF